MIEIIERLAQLAESGEAPEVLRPLGHAAAALREDPKDGAREVAALFGGMGSLNDVVLYRDGAPQREENREFDALRNELFDLSVAIRTAG